MKRTATIAVALAMMAGAAFAGALVDDGLAGCGDGLALKWFQPARINAISGW